MKAILYKTGKDYLLKDDKGETLAITGGMVEGKKLSKSNCDEIFGIVDVNKLANKTYLEHENNNLLYGESLELRLAYKAGIVDGFNKAMELNKDKLFTLGQLITAMDMARVMVDGKYANSGEYIYNFIQQPTEIEVEIEQVLIKSSIDGEAIWEYKLDSEGCLILKKYGN